jgi:putative ATP-dependent endonuclease of the OLD family
MKIMQVHIAGFRGYDEFMLRPDRHVLLVGEPRAGRSDLLVALSRVLYPDSTRLQLEPWDFFDADTTRRAEVELVLGDLGTSLEQQFLRHLEVWDSRHRRLVERSDSLDELDADNHEWVLRICYRAHWDEAEEDGEHWVDFAKDSDPERDNYVRMSRAQRRALPFTALHHARPLAVRAEGEFRRLLEDAEDPSGLVTALADLARDVEETTARLSSQPAVLNALTQVLSLLRDTLRIGVAAQDVVRFAPEGGSVPGLLRSLQALLNLGDEVGFLPLRRHGSTLAAQLSAAETCVAAFAAEAVVTVDDFGDALDAASAEHLASVLRGSVGQLWLSTRRPEVARAFPAREITRLSRDPLRRPHATAEPIERAERLAIRHLHRQLLPAMTANCIAVCEGVHDAATLAALADRRRTELGLPLPAAYGIRFVEADGIDMVPRIATLAKDLGFRVIALLDYDRPGQASDTALAATQAAADGVARLPERFAIERALVHGVDAEHLRQAASQVMEAFAIPWPQVLTMGDNEIVEFLIEHLKDRNGLHVPFLDALPNRVLPPVAAEFLQAAIDLGRGSGQPMRQLTA